MLQENAPDTSNEQGPTNSFEGAFGPAELMQYPDSDTTVQYAESYTEPGTEINWSTLGSPGTVNTEKPQALITDTQNNLYYLDSRGRIYDVSTSARTGKVVIANISKTHPMPNVTIGQPVELFGRQVEVRQAIVATEKKNTADATTTDAKVEQENPFQAVKASMQELRKSVQEKSAEAAAQAKRDAEEAAKKAQKEAEENELRWHSLREARQKVELAARGRQLLIPVTDVTLDEPRNWKYTFRLSRNRPGHVTTHAPGSEDEALDALLGPTSRYVGSESPYGVEMSPRPRALPEHIKDKPKARAAIHNIYLNALGSEEEDLRAGPDEEAQRQSRLRRYARAQKAADNYARQHFGGPKPKNLKQHWDGIWEGNYKPHKPGQRLLRKIPFFGKKIYSPLADESARKRRAKLHTHNPHDPHSH